MADLKQALSTFASDQDYEMMAEHAGIPAAELRKKINDAIDGLENDAAQGMATVAEAPLSDLALAAPQKKNECVSQDFEVSLFKIIGIKGTLKVCGENTSNWTADLKVCLIVAGASVWCTSYKFSPHNLGVCFSPTVGVAKADLCFKIAIHSNKICLMISGKACYWAFGWKCASFDETIFCIPI